MGLLAFGVSLLALVAATPVADFASLTRDGVLVPEHGNVFLTVGSPVVLEFHFTRVCEPGQNLFEFISTQVNDPTLATMTFPATGGGTSSVGNLVVPITVTPLSAGVIDSYLYYKSCTGSPGGIYGIWLRVAPPTAAPTTRVPTSSQPTTSRPTTSQPTTSRPTTSQPTTSRPTTSQPTTSEPTTSQPTTSEPTTSQPTTSEPTTSEPTTSEPTTASPSFSPTASPTFANTCEVPRLGGLCPCVDPDSASSETFWTGLLTTPNPHACVDFCEALPNVACCAVTGALLGKTTCTRYLAGSLPAIGVFNLIQASCGPPTPAPTKAPTH